MAQHRIENPDDLYGWVYQRRLAARGLDCFGFQKSLFLVTSVTRMFWEVEDALGDVRASTDSLHEAVAVYNDL